MDYQPSLSDDLDCLANLLADGPLAIYHTADRIRLAGLQAKLILKRLDAGFYQDRNVRFGRHPSSN